MLFRSRRVTTAADYLRAMREQQGQKEARFADASQLRSCCDAADPRR